MIKEKFEAAEDFLVDQKKKKVKVATLVEEIKHFKENQQEAKNLKNQASSSASGSSAAKKTQNQCGRSRACAPRSRRSGFGPRAHAPPSTSRVRSL